MLTPNTCRCPKTARWRPCPANVTHEEAAPSTEGSHYALSFFRKAKIEHGHHVFVYGATGAIGSAAEDFTKDEQRYDVVIDAVGKSSFGRCKRLLKPRGLYLSSDFGPLS